MQHHFNTEIAKNYDIITAILLDNLYYWIEKNKVNERNFKDGRYWTYNTKKAIAEWFPYLNERQLDYALKKMVEQGLIVKGNYNENKYDRTLWYAITDFGYSILQNCKMYDISNNIYFNNTITETNTNTNIEKKQQRKESESDELFEKFWKAYPNKVAKKYAKSFFIKLKPTEELVERMIKAIEEQKNTEKWRKDNGQYIPNPSTWLNQGRWEDVPMGTNRYGTADEIEAENLREIERMERLVNGT
jgi:DNA-binding PadR family transcriptional regulator